MMSNPDETLLIVHADDLGIARSVNKATISAMEQGVISSASIMVVCPWFQEVVDYAVNNPSADMGIHLTLTSEWKYYRWGPVAPRDKVSTLLSVDGNLLPDTATFRRNARPEEVKIEVHAQIEKALASGIRPSHLDSHMFALWEGAELQQVLAEAACYYGIPFLGAQNWTFCREPRRAMTPERQALPIIWFVSESTPANEWQKFYLDTLGSLSGTLNLLTVHPGHDDAELQAIMEGRDAWGAAWRERDFSVITGGRFRQRLRDLGIRLANWKDVAQRF